VSNGRWPTNTVMKRRRVVKSAWLGHTSHYRQTFAELLDQRRAHGAHVPHGALPPATAADVLVAFIGAHGSEIAPKDWAAIEDFVRACIFDMNFVDVRKAKNYFTVCSRLVDWATRIAGQPLEREAIFRPEIIDNFIVRGCDDLVSCA